MIKLLKRNQKCIIL